MTDENSKEYKQMCRDRCVEREEGFQRTILSHDEHNAELKKDTGKFQSNNKLTCFLYLLMRNDLPTGKVEELFREAMDTDGEVTEYTNGYLAAYASRMAHKLTDSQLTDHEKVVECLGNKTTI